MREEIPYIPSEELALEELTPEAIKKTIAEFYEARENWEAAQEEYEQALPAEKIKMQGRCDRIKEAFQELKDKLKAIKAKESFSHIQLPEDMPD